MYNAFQTPLQIIKDKMNCPESSYWLNSGN